VGTVPDISSAQCDLLIVLHCMLMQEAIEKTDSAGKLLPEMVSDSCPHPPDWKCLLCT